MVGEKGRNIDFKLARKFIRSLAKELVSDSERGFLLANNIADLETALQKSADSLPAGKLSAALSPILQHQKQRESFVSALQTEIRVLSTRLELRGDVQLTSSASGRLFEALVTVIKGKGASAFTNTKIRDVFSDEDMQLLLFRDPAPNILWAMAAVGISFTGSSYVKSNLTTDGASSIASSMSSLASVFLHCLKPWIVGRNASVAMASLAPLVPIVFESLKQSGNGFVTNIKELRTLIKEVLSFIVAVNYKEQFAHGSFEHGSQEALRFTALFDGFEIVFEALKFEGIVTQMKGLSTTEKLRLVFPLAPDLSRKVLKPPDARIGVLADIVKAQFVLLHMVLEVIYRRQKTRAGDKLLKNHPAIGPEQAGSIAVSSVVALQHDLLLDVLLSDLIVSNLLNDGEKSFICFSIFKASIMGNHVFSQNSLNESYVSKRKTREIFLKRIAVARKINTYQRVAHDTLDNFETYLRAPHKLSDYLKSCKGVKSLPDLGLRNDQAIVGWLLRMDDAEFHALVEEISHNDSQAGKVELKEEVVSPTESNVDGSSLRDDCKEADPEALFFVDTTGEENREVDANTPGKSRKNRKRKERQVLFHRHGRATEKKEECLTENLSAYSSDSMIDEENVVRIKRVNQRDEDLGD